MGERRRGSHLPMRVVMVDPDWETHFWVFLLRVFPGRGD